MQVGLSRNTETITALPNGTNDSSMSQQESNFGHMCRVNKNQKTQTWCVGVALL